jgi:hypothetical protein
MEIVPGVFVCIFGVVSAVVSSEVVSAVVSSGVVSGVVSSGVVSGVVVSGNVIVSAVATDNRLRHKKTNKSLLLSSLLLTKYMFIMY